MATYRQRVAQGEAARQARHQAEESDQAVKAHLNTLSPFDCFAHGFQAGLEDRDSDYSYIDNAPAGIQFGREWLEGYRQGREGLA